MMVFILITPTPQCCTDDLHIRFDMDSTLWIFKHTEPVLIKSASIKNLPIFVHTWFSLNVFSVLFSACLVEKCKRNTLSFVFYLTLQGISMWSLYVGDKCNITDDRLSANWCAYDRCSIAASFGQTILRKCSSPPDRMRKR